MKGLLSLLTTAATLGVPALGVAALGVATLAYGSALLDGRQTGALCGPTFDLTQDPAARRAFHDAGPLQAIAEQVRAQQRLVACDQK